MTTTLYDVADVTPEILAHAEAVEDAWFADEPHIDWEAFWDRFDTEAWFMGDMLSPAAERITRHIRKVRREATR